MPQTVAGLFQTVLPPNKPFENSRGRGVASGGVGGMLVSMAASGDTALFHEQEVSGATW